jgi:hypothetical protein
MASYSEPGSNKINIYRQNCSLLAFGEMTSGGFFHSYNNKNVDILFSAHNTFV